jgi:hypothetical protein
MAQIYPQLNQLPLMPMGYIPLSSIKGSENQILAELSQSTLTPLTTSQLLIDVEFIN